MPPPPLQIQSSVWIDVAKSDVTESEDIEQMYLKCESSEISEIHLWCDIFKVETDPPAKKKRRMRLWEPRGRIKKKR